MSNLPHIVRQRLAVSSGADHPDADLLNAFAERRLAAPERDRVLAHLGTCADCREIVALATPEESATQPVFTPARSWWSIRSYQYGAVAATLAVVAVGLMLLRPDMRQESRVAQVSTAPSAAPSVAGDVDRQRELMPKSPPPASLKKQLPASTAEAAGARGFVSGKAFVVQKPTSEPPKELDKLAEASKNGSRLEDSETKTEAFSFRAAPGKIAEGENAPAKVVGGLRRDNETAQVGTQELPAITRSAAAPTQQPAAAAPSAPPAVARSGPPFGGTPPNRSAEKKDLSANETVNVTAADSSSTAPGSAVAGYSQLQDTSNRRVRMAAMEAAAAKDEAAKRKAIANDPNYNARNVTWRISSGRLQKLDPTRNAYDDVAVGGVSRVSVVGALGTEVWVGGTDGTLNYSNDLGAHWIPVRTGAWPKDATFTGVTPTALRSVEVHLSNGERWRSADGGASWSKYQ
jgi:hypothetical protein